MDDLQQEETAGLERLMHLHQHLLILIIAFQIAKRREDVDNCIELVIEGNAAHVAVNPAYLHALRVGGRPGVLQEHHAEILTRDLIAPLSQGDGMPPMAAAQVKDGAARG
jgi:hypothetical protein